MLVNDGNVINKLGQINYVQRLYSKNMFSSPFDDYDDDVFCNNCFGSPPPSFNIPPPPCPPEFMEEYDDWTCPSRLGIWNDTSSSRQVPIAAVIVTVLIFVILALVAAFIVCRVRYYRRQHSKTSPPLQGAIIYDDLNASSVSPLDIGAHRIPWTPLRESYIQRYRHPLSPQRISVGSNGKMQRTLHHCSPQSEPFYHTISSVSGSGSDPSPSNPSGSSSNNSHRKCIASDSDEDDSLTPFIANDTRWEESVQFPQTSPQSEVKYYMSVPLHPVRPSSAATVESCHEYETLPLRVNFRDQGVNRSEGNRALPPLPSRSERYRLFLPHDRGRSSTPLALLNTDTQPYYIVKPSSNL